MLWAARVAASGPHRQRLIRSFRELALRFPDAALRPSLVARSSRRRNGGRRWRTPWLLVLRLRSGRWPGAISQRAALGSSRRLDYGDRRAVKRAVAAKDRLVNADRRDPPLESTGVTGASAAGTSIGRPAGPWKWRSRDLSLVCPSSRAAWLSAASRCAGAPVRRVVRGARPARRRSDPASST